MPQPGNFTLKVDTAGNGMRLDAYLSLHLSDCSRSRAADLVRRGCVLVDGVVRKSAYKVKPNDTVTGWVPAPEPVDVEAEQMPLDILYEDRHLLVLNKAAGVVVHPSAGHASGTLVNALLYHCPDLEGIGAERRPGIVHRLDKDTTGILVVAKSSAAHQGLSAQFKARRIDKIYMALVAGDPSNESGVIDLPLGRDTGERKKMAVVDRGGRAALTLWQVQERFGRATLLQIALKTGRTHQIRVHCMAMGHPIVGDPVYGQRRSVLRRLQNAPVLCEILKRPQRQMLHACRLGLTHPISGESLTFEAPPPADMQSILDALRRLNDHMS